MNKKDYFFKKGFTLTEIMIAIAIVGILAGTVLVNISRYRSKARASKINGEISSAVVSLSSCWTFGGQVLGPSPGGNICSLNSSYGTWPNITSDSYTYSESNEADCPPTTYFQPDNNKSQFSFLIAAANALGLPQCIIKDNWFLSASSATDQQKICCNQKMNGCTIISDSQNCDNNVY